MRYIYLQVSKFRNWQKFLDSSDSSVVARYVSRYSRRCARLEGVWVDCRYSSNHSWPWHGRGENSGSGRFAPRQKSAGSVEYDAGRSSELVWTLWEDKDVVPLPQPGIDLRCYGRTVSSCSTECVRIRTSPFDACHSLTPIGPSVCHEFRASMANSVPSPNRQSTTYSKMWIIGTILATPAQSSRLNESPVPQQTEITEGSNTGLSWWIPYPSRSCQSTPIFAHNLNTNYSEGKWKKGRRSRIESRSDEMRLIVKIGNRGRGVTEHPIYCRTADKVTLRGPLNDARALHSKPSGFKSGLQNRYLNWFLSADLEVINR